MYFHYLKRYFLDRSKQKTIYVILKTEALRTTCTHEIAMDEKRVSTGALETLNDLLVVQTKT